MRLIRYRIVRRYVPGLNAFVIQRSILFMPWTDLAFEGSVFHKTRNDALKYIPETYKELPGFKIDMKVWPLKHYVNTEQ